MFKITLFQRSPKIRKAEMEDPELMKNAAVGGGGGNDRSESAVRCSMAR